MAGDHAWFCVPSLSEGHGAFTVFGEGDQLYDTMISVIEGAQTEIGMESYIFAADEVGQCFADALAHKAQEGIRVRLHLDAFGSGSRGIVRLLAELEQAGVEFRWYNSFRWTRPHMFIRRNHRKLLVVDGADAFLGGFNIERVNSRKLCGEKRQRDTHVRVPAKLAAVASRLFDSLWEGTNPIPPQAIPETHAGIEALLVPSYSRKCRLRLACLHAGLIDGARHDLAITTPYFTPGRLIEHAVRNAANRRVDVQVLVPRISSPRFASLASRAAYEMLLTAGARVHEYLSRVLHAKTAVIDREWVVIGSANFDRLSFFVNQELVLLARDKVLASALSDSYQADLRNAEEIVLVQWRRRNLVQRLVEKLVWTARRHF